MGCVKNEMMEMQDNGDWPSHDLADKYVCTCHFEDKYLNEIIQSHGKQGTCSYCGSHADCMEYVRKFSLYLSTAIYEGLPLAVIEAMSVGKAIDASNVVGNKDCVKNGVNGYLLPMNVSDFADKIVELHKMTNFETRWARNRASCSSKSSI